MTKITILGGTGYVGTAIAKEAAKRHYDVTSLSRSEPKEATEGVRHEYGEATDEAVLAKAVNGADAIVASLAPRGELVGKIDSIYWPLAIQAAEMGARFIVVGGFGSLRLDEGAPRVVDAGEFPPTFVAEAKEMATFLEKLQAKAPVSLDWLYVSPAEIFGAHAPGEARGTYRVSGEVAIHDDNGISAISGADFATAIVDEIAHPAHHREHIGFAY